MDWLCKALRRLEVWDERYECFCGYCLALYREMVERCVFCGSKEIVPNDLREYLRR